MCLLFIHEQPPQTHRHTLLWWGLCPLCICCQHIEVLVLTRMHNRKHTGPEELRSIEKRHREQLGCVASRTSYLCSSAAPLFSPPATSFWHMLQMQSQIKVSVALMNKRAHPICASCRKRAVQQCVWKKSKTNYTWGSGYSQCTAVAPRPYGMTKPWEPAFSLSHSISLQPVPESIWLWKYMKNIFLI